MHDNPENDPRMQFEQCLKQLNTLEQAYNDSQAQLQNAQHQIKALQEHNLSYKLRLKKLTKRYLQTRFFADHDPLTGLSNRRVFEDRLRLAIVQSARHGKPLALLFIDLDKFKHVNDNLGHQVGDELLQQVADRLIGCIRRGDTACRYGGDEFIVMLPELNNEDSADIVIEKIRGQLCKPFRIRDQFIVLTVSIGMATYQADEHNANDLIHQADVAMYQAKHRNRQTLSFDPF